MASSPILVTPPSPTSSDYLSLAAAQHQDKPRFMATVAASIAPLVDVGALISRLPEAFDLDEAIGAQLDVVGEWIGRSRFVNVPIPNLYFALDIPGRGFDEGFWRGPFDSETGITRLDDDTYRMLLRAKIAVNHWDGTAAEARRILDPVFAPSGALVFVEDAQDMSMTIGVAGRIPSLLVLALLSNGYLPLKPEGVRVNYRVTSVDQSPVFGFDADSAHFGGFDTGAWGVDPTFFTD